MTGEIIKTILIPNNDDDWVLMKTNKNLYSFRLGGFKQEEPLDKIDNYDVLQCPFKNEQIKDVFTDDEYVYVLVGNDGLIVSGWTNISFSGEMNLGIKFSNIDEYGIDFFQIDELFRLSLDTDGWSKKIKTR